MPVHDHFVRLSLITGLPVDGHFVRRLITVLSSRKCFLHRTVTALAAACPNLRTLSLAGCLELCPHETLPALLSKLPQLERLDLGHCTQFHPVRAAHAVPNAKAVACAPPACRAPRVTVAEHACKV